MNINSWFDDWTKIQSEHPWKQNSWFHMVWISEFPFPIAFSMCLICSSRNVVVQSYYRTTDWRVRVWWKGIELFLDGVEIVARIVEPDTNHLALCVCVCVFFKYIQIHVIWLEQNTFCFMLLFDLMSAEFFASKLYVIAFLHHLSFVLLVQCFFPIHFLINVFFYSHSFSLFRKYFGPSTSTSLLCFTNLVHKQINECYFSFFSLSEFRSPSLNNFCSFASFLFRCNVSQTIWPGSLFLFISLFFCSILPDEKKP